jgi:hypothetical protein
MKVKAPACKRRRFWPSVVIVVIIIMEPVILVWRGLGATAVSSAILASAVLLRHAGAILIPRGSCQEA